MAIFMLEVVSASEDNAQDIMADDQGISEQGDPEDVTSPTDQEEALTIKIAAGVGKTDDGSMSILAATVEPEATSPPRPSDGDAASTHSLPVTHVTEIRSTQSRPSTARPDSSGSLVVAPSAVPRSQRYGTVEGPVTAGERMNRLEVCEQIYLMHVYQPVEISHLVVSCVQQTFGFFFESHSSARCVTFYTFSKWSARRTRIVPSPGRLYIRSPVSIIVANAK